MTFKYDKICVSNWNLIEFEGNGGDPALEKHS